MGDRWMKRKWRRAVLKKEREKERERRNTKKRQRMGYTFNDNIKTSYY